MFPNFIARINISRGIRNKMDVLEQQISTTLQFVALHRVPLLNYLRSYPYPHYQQLHALQSLQNHLHSAHSILMELFTRHHCHASTLLRVKALLDQLKLSLLSLRSRISISLEHIQEQLTLCLDLLRCEPTKKDQQYFTPNLSTQRKMYQPDLESTKERERTARVREDLYLEMQRSLKEKTRTHRALSAYRKTEGSLSTNYQTFQKHKQSKQSEDQKQKLQDLTSVTMRRKIPRSRKKYTYLEEVQRQLKQIEPEITTPRKQHQYSEEERQKSLSTTDNKSTPDRNILQELEAELPEFHPQDQQLRLLEEQMKTGPFLSKIKQENEPQPWESFQEDSLEQPQQLDDSLELMKKQEGLNETGKFKPLEKLPHRELEYSFGYPEIKRIDIIP